MLIITFEKMSNKEKSIHIVELLDNKADWENSSKKLLLHGNNKRYKKLLVSSGSTSGVDKIPSQDEYEITIRNCVKWIGLWRSDLVYSYGFLHEKESIWIDEKSKMFVIS